MAELLVEGQGTLVHRGREEMAEERHQRHAVRLRVRQHGGRAAAVVAGKEARLAAVPHLEFTLADGDLEALAGTRLGHRVAVSLEAHEAVACHPAAGAGDDEVGSRRQLEQGGAITDRPLAHDLPVGAVDALPGDLVVPAPPGVLASS